MYSQLLQVMSRQVGNSGWDQMVVSMRGAIEDRGHAVNLGIGLIVVLIVWVHWRVGRWVIRQLDGSDTDK